MDSPLITIVVTEIEAFGGAETGVVALSRWLDARSLAHRIVLYVDRIGLNRYADHPMDIVSLDPGEGPVRKTMALRRYYRGLPAGAPKPLAAGIQAALHTTLAGQLGFHTLMFDTPSLLGDGTPPAFKSRLRWAVSNRVLSYGLNSGGVTIVNSTYLAAESKTLWGTDTAIIPMGGVVKGDFRPRRPGKSTRMLSVCRIEANKRIDWLLHGLAQLEHGPAPLSARIDWHLDLVGEGSLREALRALAGELGLAKRVTFHGFVAASVLERLFDGADLFLMPARQGYGIPAVEALARGIPVLLHRESGVSDLLLGTPWATVMEGGEDSVAVALDRAVTAFLEGRHLGAPLPDIPTEDMWAERVARACGWWNG
jgi:glycosyltransferase involved in cell wall biosynthesis